LHLLGSICWGAILYEKSFNLKTISQGDLGHFRENYLIILSKVAKIALKIVFKLKLFPYKIRTMKKTHNHTMGSPLRAVKFVTTVQSWQVVIPRRVLACSILRGGYGLVPLRAV